MCNGLRSFHPVGTSPTLEARAFGSMLGAIGRRLAHHRRATGLKRATVALYAGMHPRHLAAVERGQDPHITVALLAQLATRIGIPVQTVFPQHGGSTP